MHEKMCLCLAFICKPVILNRRRINFDCHYKFSCHIYIFESLLNIGLDSILILFHFCLRHYFLYFIAHNNEKKIQINFGSSFIRPLSTHFPIVHSTVYAPIPSKGLILIKLFENSNEILRLWIFSPS